MHTLLFTLVFFTFVAMFSRKRGLTLVFFFLSLTMLAGVFASHLDTPWTLSF